MGVTCIRLLERVTAVFWKCLLGVGDIYKS